MRVCGGAELGGVGVLVITVCTPVSVQVCHGPLEVRLQPVALVIAAGLRPRHRPQNDERQRGPQRAAQHHAGRGLDCWWTGDGLMMDWWWTGDGLVMDWCWTGDGLVVDW